MKKEDILKVLETTKTNDEKAADIEKSSAEELKGFIPKARFDEVNTEKNTLANTVRERDAQLETLKNASGDVEGLKKQISDLQAANAEAANNHAAEILRLKIDAAVDAALTGAKAKNNKAVRALLDLEKATLSDDGTIKGLADQIKKLASADETKFLFDAETKPKIKGASPAAGGKEEPDGKPDFSKMSYEEMVAYLEENPDAKI